MGYDVHIVRTTDWTEATKKPITKREVEQLVSGDTELKWSSDYADMRGPEGITRFYLIAWKGTPCFWWYRDQIICKNPHEIQLAKLIQLADRLNAFVIGDEGERYVIRRNIFLTPKVTAIPPH